MVKYLIIGVIVGIVETIMALYDLKKLGLTVGDVWPKADQLNRMGRICLFVFAGIGIALVWPWQVYHWIKRIVSHMKVHEDGDLA